MNYLDLDQLNEGLPTLTSNWGRFLSEAALFCLTQNQHTNNVDLHILDRQDQIYKIRWGFTLDDRASSSYADHSEATEYGATCIAILLVINITDNKTIERAVKGNGFDYWVGNVDDNQNLLFQRKARLEISGIMKGNESNVKSRTKEKINQTDISDNMKIPAYISVIEFSKPMASFVEK